MISLSQLGQKSLLTNKNKLVRDAQRAILSKCEKYISRNRQIAGNKKENV